MKGRKPRPEELELWQQVNAKTEVMRQASRAPKSPPKRTEPKAKPTFSRGIRPVQSTAPTTRVDLAPTLTEALTGKKPVMDRKKYTHLRRGNLKPEGKIDLHGMTQERAHMALTGYVMKASSQGKRLILVVTGKGKPRDDHGPIPVRLGVLRHQVPHWLTIPPLAGIVMQVTQAHQRHGGAGAYYVYLRKAR